MKLGIIGLPGSGRATIFAALSGARGKTSKKDQRISTVKIMDERIDFLSGMFKPKKTTYARVEYLLPSDTATGSESVTWNQARVCDALIHVVRNFPDAAGTEGKLLDSLIPDSHWTDAGVFIRRLRRFSQIII